MTHPAPLVFLPGMLCDRRLWQAQIEALGDERATSAPDLTAADSIEALAEAVLAAAPERFVLIGLSMGGYVALEMARQLIAAGSLGRLEKLALIATSARPDTAAQSRVRRELLELAKRGRFQGVTPKLLPTLIWHGRTGDQRLTGTIFAMAADLGREGFIRQETAVMNRPDQRPTLPRIACPTLILCGDHDRRTPPECSEEMHARLPDSRYRLLEDCGHLPPLEMPQQVTALLADFLAT